MNSPVTKIEYSQYTVDMSTMRIIDIDDSFTKMTGYTKQDVQALSLTQASLIFPEDWSVYISMIAAEMETGANVYFEHRIRRKDGGAISVFCFGESIPSPDGAPIICITIADASKTQFMKDAQKEEILRLKKTEEDPLTGVLIRSAFENHASRDMLKNAEGFCALFLADIDDFGNVNDAYGHQIGDVLLRTTATILRVNSRECGYCGRTGGDEFAIFIPKLPSMEYLETFAEKLRKIGSHISVPGVESSNTYTFSIGYTVMPSRNCDYMTLLRQADQALYQAKRSGKNCILQYAEIPEPADDAPIRNASIDSYLNEEGWILNDMDDMIYISDPITHDLLYINDAIKKTFSNTEDEWRCKKCYEFLQGLSEPCPYCTTPQLRGEKSHIWEHTNPITGKHYILRDKLVNWKGKKARMEVAIDVSNSGDIQNALASRIEMEDALKQTLTHLSETDTFDIDFPHFLRIIRSYYNADAVHLYESDELHTLAFHNLNTQTGYSCLSGEDAPQALSSFQPVMQNFYAKNPIAIIDNIDLVKPYSLEFYDILRTRHVWAIYTMPITKDALNLGYLAIINPHRHTGNALLLQMLGSLLANEMACKQMLKKQEHQIYHDRLTGLLNRTSYLNYLDRIKDSSSLGIVLADVNGLKQVNHDLGQEQGNMVVKGIAKIIRDVFSSYPVFRFGSDDFVVLCQNISQDNFLSLIQALRERLEKHPCGASIGYAWDDFDIDINRLTSHADEFLRLEKQKYYENSDSIQHTGRARIIADLQARIEDGSFRIYLQPKVNMYDNTYHGAEALIRLVLPDKGVIPPGKFIPYLEKTETIRYIDFFVLDEVCKLLAKWQAENIPLLPISLNFSRTTFLERDFADHVASVIESYNIPKEMIELEITETMGDMEHGLISQIGKQLSERQLRLSMDDFGTKYSSLSMISEMHFDSLKLDRSLVNDLVDNDISRKVTNHIIQMCRDLNIECISEGVETAEQAELLQNMDCSIAQGYLYSKPVPVDEFEKNRR